MRAYPWLLVFCAACSAAAPGAAVLAPPPSEQVLEAPTLRLPKAFVPTSYRARLAIDPGKATFEGSIAIRGDLRQASAVLWLHGRHLAIHSAHAAPSAASAPATPGIATPGIVTPGIVTPGIVTPGIVTPGIVTPGIVTPGIATPLIVTPRGEDLLEVRAGSTLEPGDWTLELDYSGEIDQSETSGAFKETAADAAYIYTQFEAVYARRVFPCVDEPDSKVPWQLTLDVPPGVTAVSNTAVQATSPLAEGGTRYEFEPSRPLPTYLVAFGVGPFDIIEGPPTRSGTPVRMVTLAGRGHDAAYSLATTARIVDLLEDWFGIPYPYGKLDLLTIPLTLGFGAMENAGLVTFSEGLSLFEQTTPSWDKRHTWVLVAAHELAHQWFGNLVTPAWWDDIWLNEGFATWMETKIASRFEPSWHDELSELDTLQRALEADRVVSARQIREPISTADDIFNVFDAITYDKGAAILNMFESYVGDELFQRGVRDYLGSRAFGNATSRDFVAAISKVMGKDLAPAFATFLDQPGAPELGVELDCAVTPPVLTLSQRRYLEPGSPEPSTPARWTLPVCAVYDREGQRAQACALLEGGGARVPLDVKRCPRWVMPNVGGRGYYRHHYAAGALAALHDLAWPQLTWPERRAIFFDVAEAAKRADLASPGAPNQSLALALSLIDDMLAGGDRLTVGDAVQFATDLDPFVPQELRSSYESWLRSTFAATAARLGVLPRPSDDLDAELNRVQLVEAVGWFGRDPKLVQRAKEAARRWRDLPQAVRGTLLNLAVDADPALAATLANGLTSEPDRARRGEIFAALGGQRDPERLEKALALLLDPGLDFREALQLLDAPSTPATRRVAQAFFRAHEAGLMQRVPHDDTSSSGIGMLVHLFTDACDATEREAVVRYTSERFARIPGGKNTVEQALEAMDQCIASRAALEPQIRAWLGGTHTPKHRS
jgi:cytosol alanyl aminopeptidase